MKLKTSVLLVAIFLLSTAAMADIYKWTDERGVVHITDDPGRIPEAMRDKVKVYRTKHRRPAPEEKKISIPPTELPKAAKKELYGGHPLEWWKEKFDRINEEIDDLMVEIDTKEKYISIFEGGRRFGQIFGERESATYRRYKKELVEDEKRLGELKDELDELRRQARLAGVPRTIRGE